MAKTSSAAFRPWTRPRSKRSPVSLENIGTSGGASSLECCVFYERGGMIFRLEYLQMITANTNYQSILNFQKSALHRTHTSAARPQLKIRVGKQRKAHRTVGAASCSGPLPLPKLFQFPKYSMRDKHCIMHSRHQSCLPLV